MVNDEDIQELLRLTKENNVMLKEVILHIEKINSAEYMDSHMMKEFVNNVVADLFADMLLQPKGRGHVSREDIMNFINETKTM